MACVPCNNMVEVCVGKVMFGFGVNPVMSSYI